jgi:hypothetical protein
MAGIVNHHSFLILGGLVLLVWAGALVVRRARRGWLIWGLAGLLLACGWFLLRTRADRPPQTIAEIEAAISAGQPVLVEIYSNY